MRSRAADRCAVAASLLLLGSAHAQAAPRTLDVAFAEAAQRGKLPAIAWLAGEWLPQRAESKGVDLQRAFRLTFADGRLQLAAATTAPPTGCAFAGSAAFDDGPPLLFCCDVDGHEDWHVPATAAVPPALHSLLGDLGLGWLDRPRTLAVPVLVGHLAGGLAHDDPFAELLQIGASHCGDATWLAWPTAGGVRVRGRSGGGLALPAALVLLARRDGARLDALAVRAYAARDADRDEATRQFVRATRDARAPLTAMLHADDSTRLCAIDGLVRRGAGDELPAIVAAAAADMPWATLAALDALPELWPLASPSTRQRTRAALQRSDNVSLRAFDVDALDGGDDTPTPCADLRLRVLCCLAVAAFGVLGFWLRERAFLARQ